MAGNGFGNVYMFNIWQAPITKVTLNGTDLASGAMDAPSKDSKPPFVPNQAVAPRTDEDEARHAGGCFMIGDNKLTIYFESTSWNATVQLPPQADYPLQDNFFIYIAFEQLYLFDNNGKNITQPPDGAPFAAAAAEGDNAQKPSIEAPFTAAE